MYERMLFGVLGGLLPLGSFVFRAMLCVIALVGLFAGTAAEAAGFDYRYEARQGDLNSDGLTDFFVQHKPAVAIIPVDDIAVPVPLSKTALKRFALVRQTNGTFALVSTLTQNQLNQVSSWPKARVIFSNGDFNGDGEIDLFVGSLPSTLDPLDFRQVVVLAASATTTMQAVDGLMGQTYYVRSGDINGDGSKDLFVTGNSRRFVANFILQRSGSGFSIIATPSASQTSQASDWPVAKAVSVYREDLNFDGYFDFVLEGMKSVASTYDDSAVVFVQRGVGRMPVSAVPVNQQFKEIAGGIWLYLHLGKAGLDFFYEEVCVPVIEPNLLLPVYDFDWLFNSAPDAWYSNQFVIDFGPIHYTNGFTRQQETCYILGREKPPEVQRFVRSFGDYLGLGGASCEDCAARAETQVATLPGWWILSQVVTDVAAAESAAFILAAVILANNSPDVGNIDSITQQIVILAFGSKHILKAVSESSENPDAGPQPSPASENSTPGDPFQIPPEFDPDDPNKPQEKVANQESDSYVLGKNLEASGWPRPPNAHAHHIVQGGDFVESAQAREILRKAGMYQNEAANGTWLPRTPTSITNAQGHLARGMHTRVQRQEVLRRLQEALADPQNPTPADQPALRAALKVMQEGLSNGEKFW